MGRIESTLVDEGFGADLVAAAQAEWLDEYWKRTIPESRDRLYGAVLAPDGRVLSHSSRRLAGRRLEPGWDQVPLSELGAGTYAVRHEILGGAPAVDIAIPITFQGRLLGTYHTGLDRRWLEEQVAAARNRSLRGWLIVIGGILAVVLLSSLSLYRITRHTALLETALRLSDARRIGEVSQLVVGMAHEVRNPLNAIRLNLYTAERVIRGEAQLEADELNVMLSESVREIERIDDLVQQLLGYARLEPQQTETIDILAEVRTALSFLKNALDRDGQTAELIGPHEPLFVRMDRKRFRQVFLNLMNNAREASGAAGKIEVRVQSVGPFVELRLADDGPGVPAQLRERIFEPFYSTKALGAGLGLAVVRSLVEAAGGTIRYEPGERRPGSCFVVDLPRVEPPRGEAV